MNFDETKRTDLDETNRLLRDIRKSLETILVVIAIFCGAFALSAGIALGVLS